MPETETAQDNRCKRLSSLAWDRSDGCDRPSDYMQALVKDTKQLHGVLLKVLPMADMHALFSRVVTMFNTRLVELYAPLDHAGMFASAAAKQRLTEDVKLLQTTLRSLQGIDHTGSELNDFLQTFGRQPS